MEKSNSPNKDYIIQSLINQRAEDAIKISERDAIITEQYQKIQELEKENERLINEQIEQMNEGTKKAN